MNILIVFFYKSQMFFCPRIKDPDLAILIVVDCSFVRSLERFFVSTLKIELLRYELQIGLKSFVFMFSCEWNIKQNKKNDFCDPQTVFCVQFLVVFPPQFQHELLKL